MEALYRFFRREIWPRRKRFLRHSNLWLAFLVAFFVASFARTYLADNVINDVVSMLLLYASIVLGFTVGSLTFSLSFIDSDFLERLIKHKSPDTGKDAFSDLVFVFSYTSILHLLLVIWSFGIIIFSGGKDPVFGVCDGSVQRIVVFLVSFNISLGVLQFLTAVNTLQQVGNVIVKFAKEDRLRRQRRVKSVKR